MICMMNYAFVLEKLHTEALTAGMHIWFLMQKYMLCLQVTDYIITHIATLYKISVNQNILNPGVKAAWKEREKMNR